MNNQRSVKELMEKYGYVFKGSCHCDGYETWNWKKGEFQVKWRKYSGTVLIMKGRSVVKNWAKVVDLSESLKKIHDELVHK